MATKRTYQPSRLVRAPPPWFPLPHGDRQRTKNPRPPPRQGPQGVERLKTRPSPPRGESSRKMQATKEDMKSISRLGPQAAFDILRKSRDKRWTAEGLVLQALPKNGGQSRGDAPYGLCVSCSKKTAKRAHDRNRIKRRLKAAASEILPGHALSGMDYMVSGRYGTNARDFALLKKDLLWCLKKLELLKLQPAETAKNFT